MNKIRTSLGLLTIAILSLTATGCGPKAQLLGTWHLDRICVNEDCNDVPSEASTFMTFHKDGSFDVTNSFGMEATAHWQLDGDNLITDDGSGQERYRIDTLTANRLVLKQFFEFGQQSMTLTKRP